MGTSWLEGEGASSLLQDALCSDLTELGLMEPNDWFPEYANQHSTLALIICRTACPVRELCLAAGILQDLTYNGTSKPGHGIWGGQSARARLEIAQKARKALEERSVSTRTKRKQS